MEIEFSDDDLRRLAEDATYFGSWDQAIAKAYRKRVQQILAAADQRDLHFPGGNRFKKLDADRSHQHAMRINDQWRLIMELRSNENKTTVLIVAIEDYH